MIENEDKCKQCLKARRYQFDASSQNFCKIEECCKKEETELGLIKSKNDSTGLCACQDKIFEKDGMNYERYVSFFCEKICMIYFFVQFVSYILYVLLNISCLYLFDV